MVVAVEERPLTKQDKIEQFERWMTSYKAYAEDLLQIQTDTGTIIPFIFNNIQNALIEIIDDIRANGRYVRINLLKLRRAGVTTFFAGRHFWLTTTRHNFHALMMTHETKATNTIFEFHKRFYARLPHKMRPKLRASNIKMMDFNTKDRVGGLDSTIEVGTAGSEFFGSGSLVNLLHLSEYAKYSATSIDDLMTSLAPTIPKTDDSEVVKEYTANGIGNRAYADYWASKYKYRMFLDEDGNLAWNCEIDKDAPEGNTESSIFIPWFVFDKNQMPVAQWERQTGMVWETTKEEQEIIDLHMKGVVPSKARQKLAWRRLTIVDDFKGNVDKFNQENPPTDYAAFISSGEPAFDVAKVISLMEAAKKDLPIARYEVDLMTGQFLADKNGRFWVWEECRQGESYAIAADVAEGRVVDENEKDEESKHDFSFLSVKHHLTGRECACWHGKIPPDHFGLLLYAIHRRYGDAWVIPERNNDGKTTIDTLFKKGCKKIYVSRRDNPPHKPEKILGFLSSGYRSSSGEIKGVRTDAVNALIIAMRDNRHGIRCWKTFEEMLSFVRDKKGRFAAQPGRHDDRVTTECIAKLAIPLLPLPAMTQVATASDQYGRPQPVTPVVTETGGWF